MPVYKRYKGRRVSPGSKDYARGTWYVYKQIKGQSIHQAVPEAVTKKEAEAAERCLIEEAYNRRYGFTAATTFHDFADGVYRRYARQQNVNLKAKETDIAVFLKFFPKRTLLSEITPQDCRDLQHRLASKRTVTDRDRSPSTVNRTMSTLSKIFTLACEQGLLDRNPMQYVKRLIEPPPRQRLLSAVEKERFWQELERDRWMFRIVALAVNLPLRRGQILAITREAVDLENRFVYVIASKGRPPRPVPLNNTAHAILAEMCRETDAGPLVTWRGRPVRDFRTRWRKLLVRAGINQKHGTREENFHFHDLRTEFASELLRNNVNPEIVNRLFAHSSMQMTQKYMQVDRDELFDAVNRIARQTEPVIDSEVIQ